MKFDLYSTNPFEKDITYRIKEYNAGKLTAPQQFVKNMIAYLFYVDGGVIYDKTLSKKKIDQNELLDLYNEHTLHRSSITSKNQKKYSLSYYWEIEYNFLMDTQKTTLVENYLKEISSFKPCIEKLEKLIEAIPPYLKTDISLEKYLNKNKFDTEIVSFLELKKLFDKIANSILTALIANALNNFKFNSNAIPADLISLHQTDLKHLLHPTLLSETETAQFHQVCKRWMEHLINEIIHFLDLEEDHLFDEVRTEFDSYLQLNDNSQPHQAAENTSKQSKQTAEIDYPKYVFKDAKDFLFFDACAKQITSHKMLSFLYRKMFEKDETILIKDAAFREWFNQQNYPLKLDYPTDTYQRAATKERQEWMAIVEHFYTLNM